MASVSKTSFDITGPHGSEEDLMGYGLVPEDAEVDILGVEVEGR